MAALLALGLPRPAGALDRSRPMPASQASGSPSQGRPHDRPPDTRRGTSGLGTPPVQAVAPDRGSDSGSDGGALATEQISVRELMHLETVEALELARGRARNHRYPDSAPASAGPGREGLKLLAIYGVGKKLLAEVRVGSRPLVYLRGQPLPLGAKADAQVYRLHGITGSCVHLERRGEAHTLCLHPSQWAGG